jgi:uncharacterized membrane protein
MATPAQHPPRAAQAPLARACEGGVCWEFRRNCALSPRQLLTAFALAGIAALLIAGFFWVSGVRWVMPFAVLETSALGVAFVWVARHATDRERLRLGETFLLVECEQGGALQRWELPRQGLQVCTPQMPSGLVGLQAGGQRVAVGRHLPPVLRERLATELRLALRGVNVAAVGRDTPDVGRV